MASTKGFANGRVGDALQKLSATDRALFLEEKRGYVERKLRDSQLLDELCFIRVVARRLSEGYAVALGDFEQKVEERTRMRAGWRKSTTVKRQNEFESPMPWLHPFKLAGDELAPFEAELEAAVLNGESQPIDPERLARVLGSHDLELPLPSPQVAPRFPPGGVRSYK